MEEDNCFNARIEFCNGDVYHCIATSTPDKEDWEKFTSIPWNSDCGVASIYTYHPENIDSGSSFSDFKKRTVIKNRHVFVDNGKARGAMTELINKLSEAYGEEPLWITEY